MKRLFNLIVALLMVMTVSAQMPSGQPQFSPEKFWADMEKFISTEAGLTPQQASKFFPIYREMWKKQRTLYERQQQLAKIKPADEKGCREAIKKNDELDVEIKQLQQSYHNKMLNVIPASKLYDVIKAVDRFHRRELRRWGNMAPNMNMNQNRNRNRSGNNNNMRPYPQRNM